MGGLKTFWTTVNAVADKLGVARQTLHNILAEKSSISPEMALRLGKLFGNGPQIWLRMQQAVDLWKAEQKLAGKINKIPTLQTA
jgi:addiction module HigA family antidote